MSIKNLICQLLLGMEITRKLDSGQMEERVVLSLNPFNWTYCETIPEFSTRNRDYKVNANKVNA